MPVWKRTIDLEPHVTQYKEDGEIEKLAESVARQIEVSGWLEDTQYPLHLQSGLAELRKAKTQAEYVTAFNLVYDVADEDRVWIETT